MSRVTPELERVMREVGSPASVAYQNLQSVIESSPLLLQQMNVAIEHGHLKHVAWMPVNENAGASYDPATQTINLKQADVMDPKKHDALTFILGHELQHGLNRESTRLGYEQFSEDALRVLQNGQPVHDYTPVMRRMLEINRHDEATAHIAGWNALVSRERQRNPRLVIGDASKLIRNVDYVQDFLDFGGAVDKEGHITAKNGITLNPDLSITPDARNIEATARHYFDKLPEDTKLGYNGNSDYINYYATSLVGSICQTEMINPTHAGRLALDMQGLKLQEPLLEQNGISLGKTRANARCAYIDVRSPAIDLHFDHTADSHRHVPVRDLPQPVALPPASVVYDPREPRHPDHALYMALKECIPFASHGRLAQFSAACHVTGITGENLLRAIPLEETNQIWFERSWPPGPFAKVDLMAPMPTSQQMHEQVQVYDEQQQAIEQARFQARQAEMQQQQGPMPGVPMR